MGNRHSGGAFALMDALPGELLLISGDAAGANQNPAQLEAFQGPLPSDHGLPTGHANARGTPPILVYERRSFGPSWRSSVRFAPVGETFERLAASSRRAPARAFPIAPAGKVA